jgi:ornithine cyclodeaminase/alanine dehydrogenase
MGFKAYHGNPEYGARFLVILSSMHTGEVLAAIDGIYLTAVRTAATSAVAANYLAPRGPWHLAIIGSGLEAETHCKAMATINEIIDIRVFSPNAARREAFAARMHSELGIPVVSCETAQDAVRGAHHVVVATHTGASCRTAYDGAWLEKGQHLTSIGSTNQRMRELDTDVFRLVDTMVFDVMAEQVAKESADVLTFCAQGGRIDEAQWLPDIVSGRRPGRSDPAATTLFKSVGSAVEDMVAAAQVYQVALERGLGLKVSDLATLKLSPSVARG